MRYFMDSVPGQNVIGDNDSLMFRSTNNYFELIYPIDESSYIVVNVIPRNDYSCFVATCFDDGFDEVVENLNDDDYAEVVCDTWPLFAQLLQNGARDKYSQGALIKLEDFDTGDVKWFLASVAGNLSFDDLGSLLSSEQMENAIKVVLDKTADLCNELTTKTPSNVKYFFKGMGQGLLALLALGFGGVND